MQLQVKLVAERSMQKMKVCTLVSLLCTMGLLYFMYTAMTLNSFLPQHGQKITLPTFKTKPLAHKNTIESDNFNLLTSIKWESLTTDHPVLRNSTSVACSSCSRVIVNEKTESYRVGDVVTVDIIVKDVLGRRKETGGDLVRIWIKDQINGACAVGYVEDKNDGSYRGTVKLLWAGNVTILARISASLEMIRFLYGTIRSGRTKLLMKGLFKRGQVKEIKKCSPIQDRYIRSCNLTDRNSGLPWYCDMPHSTSCADWLSSAYFYSNVTYTLHEKVMFKRVHQYQRMKGDICLQVKSDVIKRTQISHDKDCRRNLVPCNKLPNKMTWASVSPRGYFTKGVWYSTHCRSTFDGSVNAFNTCLYGRKLWLLGDSTLRQFFSFLGTLMKLKLKTETWSNHGWHKPSTETNENQTVTIFWGLHALPFYHATGFDQNLRVKGAHLYIDSIPAKSKDIVVVHFYMHFMAHHPYIFRSHVQKARNSIKALKVRAPDTKVIVKGSRAFHNEKTGIGMFYDFWGVVYNRILREEFASIVNDVIFLDLWEITMSAENWDRHPNTTLLKAIINHMMSFICQ